ncbi:hypothetical protein [Bacillus sp. PS06]|uniref:hypothetical protein n=1 Tax=Bacillus sp. PS06 TaxID=2764176 RepID=UPI00177C9A47|nr:hypothetical protein [Bacillus sp. PS06]MBD8069295.1 hypothetical protein [Bacillus sp. PS06]
MQFIEPKKRLEKKADWRVSEHTKLTVKHYADYTGYTEDEVVDIFLKNLLDDQNFIDWINQKRRNKRIVQQLALSEEA